MIIKYQFKLNISMPRIVFGVLLLALGISMLLGGPGLKTQSNIIFSEGNVQAVKPEKEYNVIFGNLVIDLATISRDELGDSIKINTVFGNTLVKIDPNTPTLIKVTSAFGSGSTRMVQP